MLPCRMLLFTFTSNSKLSLGQFYRKLTGHGALVTFPLSTDSSWLNQRFYDWMLRIGRWYRGLGGTFETEHCVTLKYDSTLYLWIVILLSFVSVYNILKIFFHQDVIIWKVHCSVFGGQTNMCVGQWPAKMTVRGTMVRSEVCNSWCFCLES